MWVFVTFIYLIPAVAVAIQTLSPGKDWRWDDHRRARLASRKFSRTF
jgi:hypothetical protein